MNEEFEVLLDRHIVDADNHDTDDVLPLDDDRYPGSFFRIPRPPIAGQTSWSLS